MSRPDHCTMSKPAGEPAGCRVTMPTNPPIPPNRCLEYCNGSTNLPTGCLTVKTCWRGLTLKERTDGAAK